MPNLKIRNLAAIKNGTATPAMHGEALEDLAQKLQNMAVQTNANPDGPVAKPPQITDVNVSAVNGQHHVTIFDDNPVNRGITYFTEFSTTPDFKAGTVFQAHQGSSRSPGPVFLGNLPVAWRAFSAYPTGPASDPVYFGAESSPTLVNAGGTIGGPALLPGTGSGTENSSGSQGGQGFGLADTRVPVLPKE